MSKEETNINIDFTDIYACLSQGENHKVAISDVKGKEAAKQAIEKIINSFSNPTDAKSIVLNFELHPDYPMMELMSAMDILYSTTDENAEVVFGTITNNTLDVDFVKISAIMVI